MLRTFASSHRTILTSLFLMVSWLFLLQACGGGGGGGGGGAPLPNNVPRFAYVANQSDNTVSQYTVNATTGQLRHNGYALTGNTPVSVGVDRLGKFAYVANAGTSDISAYTINSNGTLTPIDADSGTAGIQNFPTGTSPTSVTIDPTGKFVYVANSFNGGSGNSVSAYTIDTTTGVLTPIAGSPFTAGTSPQSVTINPAGTFAYVANGGSNNVSAYAINATTGVLTPVAGSPFDAGTSPQSVTINPAGTFAYVANGGSSNVSAYTITTTGVLTPVAGSPFTAGTSPQSVTINPAGTFAYVANGGSSNVSAYTINTTTGVLTPVAGSPFTAGTSPQSVTVDPSGKFVYVTNSTSNEVSAFTIDLTSGALTALTPVRTRNGGTAMAMTKGTAAVRYSPKFAYVANSQSHNVSAFTINAANGALSQVSGSPFASGTSPRSVAADPLGKFVYTTNLNGSISAYSIDPSTGVLTSLGADTTAVPGSYSINIDPSGRFAYVANNDAVGGVSGGSVSVYTIDSAGTLTSVTGSPYAAGSGSLFVTVDPTGRFVYVANYNNGSPSTVSGYTINAVTGALTPMAGSPFTAGSGPRSISVDPSGRFAYVAILDGISAYTINAATGVLSPMANSPFAGGSYPQSITIDPFGKYAYLTDGINDDVSVFSINGATGALTNTGAIAPAGFLPYSIAIDPSGKFAYVANSDDTNVLSTYTINSSTGALTASTPVTVGDNPFSVITIGTIQ